MKNLGNLIAVLLLVSQSVWAFEFNNSSENYDFTQTVEILIVDQKGSKFFAMLDPFEMKVTTVPSRFYVAVMGVLERGHKNGEGVTQVQGNVTGYEYVLLFRSLNSAHVMFVSKNWIVDGNKIIQMTPAESQMIYEILIRRSDDAQSMDLDRLNGLFKEINDQQAAPNAYPQPTEEDELKSIVESKKSLEARLPESHNDTITLPYYNKALENEKFLEEWNASKKEQQAPSANTPDSDVSSRTNSSEGPSSTSVDAPTAEVFTPEKPIEIAGGLQNSHRMLGISLVIGMLLLTWVGWKWRTTSNLTQKHK